ncbi:hypothetical protein IFO69_09135 [Echinicola sp. CAU 1574]|uniref:Antimicrobial peptide n=1 Tax=Echinicola arenosa TaxID=2774144 RepID=A0ABR9AJD1_9BACT|nr:hypothetical protein [Echinicola arenosa]MBD8488906.1 hypothetical protein [Echinicola arenosa]
MKNWKYIAIILIAFFIAFNYKEPLKEAPDYKEPLEEAPDVSREEVLGRWKSITRTRG